MGRRHFELFHFFKLLAVPFSIEGGATPALFFAFFQGEVVHFFCAPHRPTFRNTPQSLGGMQETFLSFAGGLLLVAEK